jgi:hypothetical protein
VQLIEADVVAEDNRYRHDSAKLAAIVLAHYYGREITPTTGTRTAAEAPLLVTR